MYHEPQNIKNPGKIVICTIPQDFPSPRFFGKNGERGEKKNNLVWSTNVPGERISLENESLENPLGKIVVRKPLENPNLSLCAGKVLVRKPAWKIPICFYVLEKFWRENPPGKSMKIPMCFYYVLEKFWGENPVGKKRQANLSNLFPPANSLGEASRHRNGLEARPQVKLRLPIHVNTFESPQLI